MQVQLGSRLVGDGCPTFIIAEIGQNHQGDVYQALRLCREAVLSGADAVKFQLRDAENEFSQEVLDAPHPCPEHAFGATYREHRAVLDLTADQLASLQSRVAYNQWEVEFFVTPCHVSCVEPLEEMGIEFYKIASKDRDNDDLWDAVRATGKPFISSSPDYSGLAGAQVRQYCVQEYPAPLSHIDLSRIRECLPISGYSDHSGNPAVPILAAGVGARTIEVHVTHSKHQHGRDHKASLEMAEFATMVKAIREIDDLRNGRNWNCWSDGCSIRPVVDLSASGID